MKGNSEKYVVLNKPEHPNSNTQGKIREHVYKASLALGRKLKTGEHVHHVDYNPRNNSTTNLVVCSNSYHRLLHARTDALNACGNANYMKCPYCKQYDDPANMYVRPRAYQAWHRECSNKYKRVDNPQTGPYRYGKS